MPLRATLLGTGIMGAGMAANLAKAGLVTTVWNRSRDKAEAIGGVTVADTAEEAVRDADLVVTMLFDGDSVAEVMERALPEMRDDAIWLQTTTVGTDAIARLADMAAKRGVGFVDAPVMGTRQPAESGQLTVLAAGADETIAKAEPVFDAVGAKTVRLGTEVGAASRFKLVMNAWVVSLTTATAQSVAFCKAAGIDPQRFLDAIAGGPLDSGYAQAKGKAMIAGDFSPSFAVDGAAKDASLVAAALDECGADSTLATAVATLMRKAMDAGDPHDDMAAVLRAFQAVA
ncbi:NAD(P)-dependent oxidoreductase [Fodinicola acaciae]|uniref:NAD(P)-dependent oxidoreductase n=1 Tax=Fodinicola acaciae TaxID=2681555 RepID=UPI0013CFD0AA|nr:NAD(P)-dependent oxidoreductase [Fodinicola acaciae]